MTAHHQHVRQRLHGDHGFRRNQHESIHRLLAGDLKLHIRGIYERHGTLAPRDDVQLQPPDSRVHRVAALSVGDPPATQTSRGRQFVERRTIRCGEMGCPPILGCEVSTVLGNRLVLRLPVSAVASYISRAKGRNQSTYLSGQMRL